MSNETIIAIAVGALFGLISIVQTWRIQRYNKRNRIRKSIEYYYEIKKSISVNNIPYDLLIQHNSKGHKNIFYIEGMIGNKSNVVFSNSDLLKPLQITSNEQLEVLEIEIIDKTKDSLECGVVKETKNGNDFIQVVINNFEPNDAFKFRLLVASNEDKIKLNLEGLIKDENVSIKPKTIEIYQGSYRSAAESDRGQPSCGLVLIMLSGILIGLYFLFLWIQKLIFQWLQSDLKFTISSSEILSFVLSLTVCIGLVALIIWILKKIKIDEWFDKRRKEPSLTGFGPWFDLRIRSKDMFSHLN